MAIPIFQEPGANLSLRPGSPNPAEKVRDATGTSSPQAELARSGNFHQPVVAEARNGKFPDE